MVDEEHPTTKSDSKPYKRSYEKPEGKKRRKNLSGSLTKGGVTIIGNDPRATSPTDLIQNDTLKYDKKGKVRMRDLSKTPDEEFEVESNWLSRGYNPETGKNSRVALCGFLLFSGMFALILWLWTNVNNHPTPLITLLRCLL